MINIPSVKEYTIMKKFLEMGKNKGKGRSFDRPKIQIELIYDGYNYQLCVYSNKMVGAKGGPTKSHVEEFQLWL